MLTHPTRVFFTHENCRLIGVPLTGRRCGMAAALKPRWTELRLRGLTVVSGPHEGL